MCVGGGKPKPPPPDPAVEAEQAERKAAATEKAKEARAERLESALTTIGDGRRGGRGRRSLITGTRGGMGYYNEYMS